MVFILQRAIWGNAFKLLTLKLCMNTATKWRGILSKWDLDSCLKMWRLLSSWKVTFQAPCFWILICNSLEVLHSLQLVLCLIWVWALVSCFVVFVVCVISRTMKRNSLESITRSIAKSKPTLLWYFFSIKNASNAKF
jgi:hypothetical protein